jgi:hypothetical protein
VSEVVLRVPAAEPDAVLRTLDGYAPYASAWNKIS